MLCSIWLAGSLLPCCDVLSLLVLLISLPLPHYRCLTTALLCVVAIIVALLLPLTTAAVLALSAAAVWLHCERGGSLLGIAAAPASMQEASPPSKQIAREARQGQARLPAECHAGREPEVETTNSLTAVPRYVRRQSEPSIAPPLLALHCESRAIQASVRCLQLPFALGDSPFEVPHGAEAEAHCLELLMK